MAVAANLRLDREPDQQRDDRDERDERRDADDRPGLAADEVAPLVVEGVDAALDPLAELAGGRHRLAVCEGGAFAWLGSWLWSTSVALNQECNCGLHASPHALSRRML